MRKCYNCGRDLKNEPAIKGLKGLLCFVCRYNFDKEGGEKFLIEHQIYQEAKKDWEIAHKDKWISAQRFKRFADISLYLIAIFLFLPLFLFLFEKMNKMIFFTSLGGSLVSFILFLFLRLKKVYYIPPPIPPKRDKNSLFANLDVIYEEENDEFLKVKGYPPDWEERKKMCLSRDLYRCRICEGKKHLHIHHIKPISYGGTHSLQNLITLCDSCHKKIRYYQHQDLIIENIKANRRYLVSSYIRKGKVVSAYIRKTGRRGLFWRKIWRVRS